MRAARAFLRWSAGDLAQKARIGVQTVRRAEVFEGEIETITRANELAMRGALEGAGVVFLAANEDGPGVRLKGVAKDA